MSIHKRHKLMMALSERWPPGVVATSPWLRDELSISRQLVQRYLKGGWIESIGSGAYKRKHDKIHWSGAVASLQRQLRMDIHLGGPTAISAQGASHYARLGEERVYLFTPATREPPQWFQRYDWGNPIELVRTSFLPKGLAIETIEVGGVGVGTSSRERAILECLYLSPKKFDLLECYQIMEGLVTLRPQVLQRLLVHCSSIKVKRLFLYMAEKANLPVLKHLDLTKIELGSGDRSIVRNGVYNSKHRVSLPRELVEYE